MVLRDPCTFQNGIPQEHRLERWHLALRFPVCHDALTEALAGGNLGGAACQLADDLLDITAPERIAGKTLGTDSKWQKFTLPYSGKKTVLATYIGQIQVDPFNKKARIGFLRLPIQAFISDSAPKSARISMVAGAGFEPATFGL